MKLLPVASFCMLLAATFAHAQTVALDNAINRIADNVSGTLNKGTIVAVLAVRTDSPRMAAYLIDEITSAIVDKKRFTVVDRHQLDLIQQEMDLQLSGEISDESARSIGKKLGAQVIIAGSFDPVGDYHRFRLRIIEVETTAILANYSENVRNDPQVMSLLKNDGAVLSSDYADFTAGQRWGTGALNLVPGLGSYVLMHDIVGGSVNLGLMAVGGAFLYTGITDVHFMIGKQEYSMGTPALIAGSVFLLGGTVFNIVRSATYHKPPPKTALADPSSWNIALLPGKDGIEQVRLSWAVRF